MIVKQGRTPAIVPFDMTGVVRDEGGVLRYTGLPTSLVTMLRATVDVHGAEEALVEVGGPRVSYRSCGIARPGWAAGHGRVARGARGHPPGQR